MNHFQEDLGKIPHEYKEEDSEKISLITKMEKFYYDLVELWGNDNHACLKKLKQWTQEFNENLVTFATIICSVKERLNEM